MISNENWMKNHQATQFIQFTVDFFVQKLQKSTAILNSTTTTVDNVCFTYKIHNKNVKLKSFTFIFYNFNWKMSFTALFHWYNDTLLCITNFHIFSLLLFVPFTNADFFFYVKIQNKNSLSFNFTRFVQNLVGQGEVCCSIRKKITYISKSDWVTLFFLSFL